MPPHESIEAQRRSLNPRTAITSSKVYLHIFRLPNNYFRIFCLRRLSTRMKIQTGGKLNARIFVWKIYFIQGYKGRQLELQPPLLRNEQICCSFDIISRRLERSKYSFAVKPHAYEQTNGLLVRRNQRCLLLLLRTKSHSATGNRAVKASAPAGRRSREVIRANAIV